MSSEAGVPKAKAVAHQTSRNQRLPLGADGCPRAKEVGMGFKQDPQFDTFFEPFIEQACDHALLFFDVAENIVWASAGAEKILGLPAAELIGKNSCELFVPEDVEAGIPAHEFAIARSRGSSEDDRWMMRPDGSRFWAMGLAYALRDKQGDLIGYGKLFRNRTDAREQQLALKNQVVDLAEQDERKNRMIATFAHEVRGPLTPLVNATEILREAGASSYAISLIERQVDFIGRLIDDLMEATSVHVGKVHLNIENLLLQDVLHQSVEAVRSAVDQQEQHLDVLLPPIPLQLQGDAVRLRQVFMNLLGNATKYTPRGGKIWLKVTTEGNEAVVRVEDNGIGIAPAMLSHIFELFAQVHAPRSAEGGVGIGLSLVKDLVTLHGGSVQANSDGVGKGSDFIVRLPMGPPEL
jgi:PAS domain S-box-containing protein